MLQCYKKDNIKFHNEASEDPDCFVKKVFLFFYCSKKKILKKVLINFWKMAQKKEEHLDSA